MDTLLGDGLLADVRTALPSGVLIDGDAVGGAPNWPGAYVVMMQFSKPVEFTLRGAEQTLAAGSYAYCGSAYGPGGVGARLRRHFRTEKKVHWHVDQLMPIADQLCAVAERDGSECALADRLVQTAGFRSIVPGFGSSDCRTCSSHLLAWTGAT